MRLGNISYFYHVYTAGSINQAALVMHLTPPAVSIGLGGLEDDLGFKLFKPDRRTPLPVAHEFFKTVAAPVVEGMAAFAHHARGLAGPLLRVGASEFILQEYVVPLLVLLQRSYPALRVTVHSAPRAEIEERVSERKIDLAVVTTDEAPAGFSWQSFVTVDPVLLVREDAGINDLDTLLAGPPPRHRLVCPPLAEGVCRRFEGWLRARGVRWEVMTVASSTALVPWIVEAGGGVGLCVAARTLRRPGVRALPLPLPPLPVGAFWRGDATPVVRTMLELIGRGAEQVTRLRAAEPAAGPRRTGKKGARQRADSNDALPVRPLDL